MDHMFMRDKVAVVTGSGRGIGEAIARRLAEFGAKVVITDINMETAQRVVDDIIAQGGQAKCVLFNVADVHAEDTCTTSAVTSFRFAYRWLMVFELAIRKPEAWKDFQAHGKI